MFFACDVKGIFNRIESACDLVSANYEDLSTVLLQQLITVTRQILKFGVQHWTLHVGKAHTQ